MSDELNIYNIIPNVFITAVTSSQSESQYFTLAFFGV